MAILTGPIKRPSQSGGIFTTNLIARVLRFMLLSARIGKGMLAMLLEAAILIQELQIKYCDILGLDGISIVT
jgi:hypothetical protein